MAPLQPSNQSNPSKIGARNRQPAKPGVVPKSNFERHLSVGEFLFREGDTGTEMFIIKKGKVKILKEEGSTVIELVTLGPGSVLGEMSLLDNAPRSASAQAVEPLSVTIIDQNHLHNTLSKVPGWLNNVIKIVVQRLRDTTNRNYKDMLNGGFIALLKSMMYLEQKGAVVNGDSTYFPVDKIKELSYSLYGLSSGDAEKLIQYLNLISLATLQKNKAGKSFLKIKDPEIIRVFYHYRKTLWKGKKPQSQEISEPAAALASAIYEAGKTRAARRQEFLILDQKQLQIYREQMADYDEIDPDLLEELEKAGLINMESKTTATKQSTYNKSNIMYLPGVLSNFVKECDWREVFDKNVSESLD